MSAAVTTAAPLAARRLSREQARALTDEACCDLDGFIEKLTRLYDGGAHLALGYRSFAAYCRAEFALGNSRAYQLLKAGRVFDSVHNCGLASPANEAQARELTPLLDQPDLLEDTWGELLERHGGQLTAAAIRAGVERAIAAEQQRAASIASSHRRAQRLAQDAAAGHGHAAFHQGDFRDHLHTVEDSSVRLLLTDPPYGINYKGRPYFFQDGQIAGDQNPEQAAGLLAEMLELIKPKLAEQAHLLVFASPRYDPLTRAVIENAGFQLRSFLIWAKDGHGVGDCSRSFGPEHECIVHASTGSAPIRLRKGSVLSYPRVRPHLHPTQKPVGLLAELIQALADPGELVCDPFAGVGSTLVAATATGRNAWGSELNPDWHTAGSNRLPHARDELDAAQAETNEAA